MTPDFDGATYLLIVAAFLLLLCSYGPVSWLVDRIYGPES